MDFWNDLRLGARSLAKRPGFTAVAVLTLGLGIGANAAIFAVVNAVLIRPLPYPDSERLVWFGHHAPGLDLPDLENSEMTVALYAEQARSFVHVASYEGGARNLTGGTEPARVQIAEVTPSLFDVLSVAPARGRRLVDADAAPGAPPVAVLTHKGCTDHFGRSPGAVGETIE
ncbi:MAG: ABC transporter permease, partial [Longimicrobiales bacterium]